MRKLTLAIAALAAGTSQIAFAQDTGPYIGIDAGIIFPQHEKYNIPGLNGSELDTYEVAFKPGYDVDANIGYDFGMFRLEAEGSYKRAKIDREKTVEINGFNPATYTVGGHDQAYSAMANALIDFGKPGGVTFFAGGGAGVAWHKFDYQLQNAPGTRFESDTKSAFAWQALAGIRAPLSPSVDVGLKYRYFNAGRFNHDATGYGVPGNEVSSRFRSHSILASLTYNFGRHAEEMAPPPPPPPPPAPVYEPAPPPPPPPPAPVYEPAPPPPPGERG